MNSMQAEMTKGYVFQEQQYNWFSELLQHEAESQTSSDQLENQMKNKISSCRFLL